MGKKRNKKGSRGHSGKSGRAARPREEKASRRTAGHEQVHRAARDLIERRLWERLDDTDWFLLEIPELDQPQVVTVLGSAEISRGLWLLRGTGGVEMLRKIRDDTFSHDALMLKTDGLMLGVVRARDVPPAHRRFLRQAGVNPRGDIEVPMLTVMRPGKQPRALAARDLDEVLWSLRGIMAADRLGMLVGGRMRSDDKWATLVVSGSPEDPSVALEWRLPPTPAPDGEVRPTWLPDRGALEALPLLETTWQVGLPVSSARIASNSALIRTLLVLEKEREFMVSVHAFFADRAEYVAAEYLVDIFSGENEEGVRGIPTELQVTDELLFDLLAPELRRLGVRCSHVTPAPSPLREAIDSLEQHLSGVSKDSPPVGEEPARQLLAETTDGELLMRDASDPSQGASDLGASPVRSAAASGSPKRRSTSIPAEGDIGAWKTVDRQLIIVAMGALPAEYGEDLRLATRYFGEEGFARGVLQDPVLGSLARSALADWLWLDYRPGGRGPTHAERILAGEVAGVTLMPAERIILEGLVEAPISLFVVRSVEPGQSLIVEDLLRGGRREVRDRSLSETAQVEMGLFARVYPVGGSHFMSGLGPPLSPFQIDGAQQVLDDLGLQTTSKALRRGAHLFGSLWYWQQQLPVIPEIRTNDGEISRMNEGVFHAEDPARIWSALRHHPDLEPDDELETIQWFEPNDSASEPSIIAQFSIEDDHITAMSNADSRWERARALMEDFDGVTLVSHEARSMRDILAEMQEREAAEGRGESDSDRAPGSDSDQAPGSDSDQATEVDYSSPEIREQITAVLLQRQLAWADDSIPALGGKSPREAVRTAAGKRKVQQMIRAMPSVSLGAGIEPLEPPRAELRRELGLPKE